MFVARDDLKNSVPKANDSDDGKGQTDAQKQPKTIPDLQRLSALGHQLPTDEDCREEHTDEKHRSKKEGFA
jgi:hypothetical protein